MTLVLRYSARSDRGLVRQNNQDAVYAGPRLLALADGMGGHAAGEVASSLVISALAPLDEDDPGDDLLRELREAAVEGNAAITRHVSDAPDLEGMGTTLTAILFAGKKLGLVHIGDSRAYQLRGGAFSQITKDDTFVQSLIDEGRITEEEAHTHPQRSLLLRAITGQDIDPSLTIREARAGDRYLLCSDGLSDPVSFETIQDVLRTGTPDEAATSLINLALRGGGPDNVTVVVADVVDVDAAVAAAEAGDAPTPTLPTGPVLAGAVNAAAPELPRPDTSAGRASAVQIIQRPAAAKGGSGTGTVAADGVDGDAGADGAGSGDAAAGPGGSGRHGRRRGLFIALAAVLVLVVAAGGTIWWVRDSLNQSYFVAVAAAADRPAPATTTASETEDASEAPRTSGTAAADPSEAANTADAANRADGADTASPSGSEEADATAAENTQSATPIIIYQGSPGSILGVSTQSAYQEICLDERGQVNMLPAGSDDPCHRFSTADLTPAARGTLDNLPTDSYEEVQKQVRRLSEQTLPPCVTRGTSDDNSRNSNGGGNSSGSSRSSDDPSDLTTPGVSCREVN